MAWMSLGSDGSMARRLRFHPRGSRSVEDKTLWDISRDVRRGHRSRASLDGVGSATRFMTMGAATAGAGDACHKPGAGQPPKTP